jgi:hypothetical protein
MEKQIQHLMEKLNLSREDALALIADDKRIDQGEKLFNLAPELEAGAKKARRADRTDTPKKANRARKIDPDKAELISILNEAVCDIADDVGEIVNEREFLFTYNDKKYKVVLSCPRS